MKRSYLKRKTALRSQSKSPRSKAKKKAWDMFSKYIRLRDALLTTGTDYEAECVTCRRRYPINKMQAGHFIPGRSNAVLFDEYGVHSQCVQCNIFKSGDALTYRQRMVEKYGEEEVKEMEILAKVSKKIHLYEFPMIYEFYKNAYSELGGVV